jgi:hypothetical protein
MLCTNATHQDHQVKLASLQTLGFICEEIETDDINSQTKNSIIVALTSTINKDEGYEFLATVIATRALQKSIAFAS